MKKNIKKIVGAILLLVILGVAFYAGITEDEKEIVYKEETVALGNLAMDIKESGTVQFVTSTQRYDLNIEEDEDSDDEEETDNAYLKIDKVFAVPGQRVNKGDAILRLTDNSIETMRKDLESKLAEAEITLEEAKRDYEMKELNIQHTYENNVWTGNSADTEYEIAAEILEQTILQAKGKIDILQGELEELVQQQEDIEDWENCEVLREKFEEAKKDFEKCEESRLPKYIELRDAYLLAKKTYENAKEEREGITERIEDTNLEILEQSQRIEELLQKQERELLIVKQTYETKSQQGTLAEEIYTYSAEALADSVSSAKAALQKIQKRMESFEEFAGDGIVYAEESGLITEVNYKEDDFLDSSGVLFSYVEADNYYISVDVSEEDIATVLVGDKVDIILSAYPDEIYQGIVTEIMSTSSSEQSKTVSYPVTIQVQNNTEKLYEGMSADVTFVTESAEQVLYVSKKAVYDGAHIQITSGLSEGENIYVERKVS